MSALNKPRVVWFLFTAVALAGAVIGVIVPLN